MAIYAVLFGMTLGQSIWNFFSGDFATGSILFAISIIGLVLEFKKNKR